MVFSDTTAEGQGLIQDITFHLGIGLTGFPIADRTRGINERYGMVNKMIFDSYAGWQFIDNNVSDTSTGLPYADQTLTSGTSLYALPSAALSVDSVSIVQGTSRQRDLQGISYEEYTEMGGDSTNTTNATPRYYILQGDVIRLVPTPNFTTASGLRIYFNQGISKFATTDTTKVPGFDLDFHRMLSIGASLDYAMARGLTSKVNYLQNLWNDYEVRLKQYYVKRWRDRYPQNIHSGRDIIASNR